MDVNVETLQNTHEKLSTENMKQEIWEYLMTYTSYLVSFLTNILHLPNAKCL